jgi:hypothetical protein
MKMKMGMCLFFAILALFLCLTPSQVQIRPPKTYPGVLFEAGGIPGSWGLEFLQAAEPRQETQISPYSAERIMGSTWSRLYFVERKRQNYIRSIVQAYDGGFLVGGESGQNDINLPWLMKLSPLGNVQWIQSTNILVSSFLKTSDGKYVALGKQGSGTSADLAVFKFDDNRTVDWAYTYGGSNEESAGVIRPTLDGDFLIAATSKSFSGNSSYDVWILKISSTGSLVWERSVGGTGDEWGNFILETGDGGFFVAASTRSFGMGWDDSWLLKFNSSGAIEWQKTIGAAGNESPSCVVITPDGGYLITAWTNSVTNSADGHVFKISADGSIVWQKLYGGDWGETTNSIFLTNDGNYNVMGTQSSWPLTRSSFWVLKITPSGTILWQWAYNALGISKAIMTSDGDLVLAGVNGINVVNAIRDGLLYRISPDGSLTSNCTMSWTTSCSPTDTNFVPVNTAVTPRTNSVSVSVVSVNFTSDLTMIDRDPCATYTEAPDAPQGLALQRTINRGIFRSEAVHTLTWQLSSSNPRVTITAHYVYRKLAGQSDASYQKIGTVAGSVTRYDDSVQALDERYVYAVAALSSDLIESPKSAPVGN